MVILYSTHCPKCQILERKLTDKKIDFKTISDVEEIKKTGFSSVPLLKVGDKLFQFFEANKWINEQ